MGVRRPACHILAPLWVLGDWQTLNDLGQGILISSRQFEIRDEVGQLLETVYFQSAYTIR